MRKGLKYMHHIIVFAIDAPEGKKMHATSFAIKNYFKSAKKPKGLLFMDGGKPILFPAKEETP